MKQILNNKERAAIRRDIYKNSKYVKEDEKIIFFKKYAEGKKVLDLGSVDHDPENSTSPLWLFGALRKVATELVGLDYYEFGVFELRNKGYNVVVGDAQNFEFNETFDVVTAGDLLEHLENPGLMLDCAIKHLNEDGFIVISTPNPFCWKYMAHWIFKGNMRGINQEHTMWFCVETLRLLVRRKGLQIYDLKYSSRRSWENWIPLPRHIKHTTINVALKTT